MTKILRAQYDCYLNRWQAGVRGVRLATTQLVRGDLYHLQVKFLNAPDLTQFGYNGLFMLKTAADYADGEDFAAAFAGYDTADTFHSTALKQFSIPFIVPYSLELAELFASVALFDVSGNKFETNTFRTIVTQAMYQGDETSLPVGIPSPVAGTAEIEGSDTSVTVTVDGLTKATGLVIITPEASTGGFVVGAVSIPVDGGEFTITVQTAPELTPGDGRTFKFTWWMVRP